MANGNGGPPWVQVLVKLLTTIGPTAVIALFVVYYLVTANQDEHRDIVDMIRATQGDLTTSLEQHNRTLLQTEANHLREFRALTDINRKICANTADTAAERSACFD